MAGRILVLQPTSLSEFTERFDPQQTLFFLTPWNGSIGLEAGKEYWLALISEETNPAECLIITQLKSGRTLYFIVMVTTRMVNQIGVSVHQFGKN